MSLSSPSTALLSRSATLLAVMMEMRHLPRHAAWAFLAAGLQQGSPLMCSAQAPHNAQLQWTRTIFVQHSF